jgi:hypothetical protein
MQLARGTGALSGHSFEFDLKGHQILADPPAVRPRSSVAIGSKMGNRWMVASLNDKNETAERTLAVGRKLLDRLPMTGEILRGSLVQRTIRNHAGGCGQP